MKQLTMRQAGMMISFSMVSIKFLVFPAMIARFAGKDSCIATSMGFILDLFFMALILFVLKKFPDKTMKEIMTEVYGVIVTKIVFFILFCYMFIKMMVIMKEAHTYFLDTLFSEFSLFMFILPTVAISLYIASRSLRTLGRTVEIVFFVIFFGIVITTAMPLEKMDIFALLPVMENGFAPVLSGLARTAFSFGDQLVLMLLIGKIKFSKDKTSKIFLYAMATAIFVILLEVIFISLFQDIALNQRLTVTDIPLHSTAPMTIGRLDWLTIILWIVTLTIQSGIFMFFSIECFSKATNIPLKWSLYIIGLATLISLCILSLGLAVMIEVLVSETFYLIIIVVQILLPLMLFLAAIIKMYKNKGKQLETKKEEDIEAVGEKRMARKKEKKEKKEKNGEKVKENT